MAQEHPFYENGRRVCERTWRAASSGHTYLEEASSGVGAIVSKNVAEPAVLFDPRGSFGHQRKKINGV
jgi:hypothetical protein